MEKKPLSFFEKKQHALVLSDYRMEPLNGIYVAATIRGMNPNVQFLMVTGFPDEEVRNFVREYDIPAPVTKPISMTHLIGVLKELLDAVAIDADHIHSGAFEERMGECPILLGDSELISEVRKKLSVFLLKIVPH